MSNEQQMGCVRRGGFTLVELLIASGISVLILAVTISVFINCMRSWHGIQLRMDADQDVNTAMSHMVYGMGQRLGLRTASSVTLTGTSSAWTLSYITGGDAPETNSFSYSSTDGNLVFNPGSQLAGRDLSFAQVTLSGTQSLVVTLRVDRVDGMLKARREIGTEISWRN